MTDRGRLVFVLVLMVGTLGVGCEDGILSPRPTSLRPPPKTEEKAGKPDKSKGSPSAHESSDTNTKRK
jgi:hypothetical protein